MAEAPAADRMTREYDLLREGCARIEPALAVIEVTGEDRKGWLQGQASNDVRQLDLGASAAFCFCSPTGQIEAVCDIWSLAGRFILACRAPERDAVLGRFAKMVVTEDVRAAGLDAAYEVVSIQGPSASRELGALVALPTLDAAEVELEGASIIVVRADRTGMGGWDVLLPRGSSGALAALAKAFPAAGGPAVEAARLEAGKPMPLADYDARTFPPELGPAFDARYVNYGKGCYTGQEVLMRIHSRGHVNRQWMGLLAEAPIAPGMTISTPTRHDAGHVTSAAFSPDYGDIGGGMVRADGARHGDAVTVGDGERKVAAELVAMPILRLE